MGPDVIRCRCAAWCLALNRRGNAAPNLKGEINRAEVEIRQALDYPLRLRTLTIWDVSVHVFDLT